MTPSRRNRKRCFPCGRRGVTVERGSSGNLASQLFNGLQGAGLVIGQHDGHEARIGTDEIRSILGGDDARAAHRQLGMSKTLGNELPRRLGNARMFQGAGDKVAGRRWGRRRRRHSENSQVVRFGGMRRW